MTDEKSLMTWDDLADFYHEKTGGTARIKPMDRIYNWALEQEEIEETKDGLRLKTKRR